MSEPASFSTRAKRHLRKRLLSGLLVLVPLGVTILILRLAFNLMSVFLSPGLELVFRNWPPAAIQVISVALFITLIYLIGVITAHVVGRRMVHLGESALLRVPLVKSIYGATKQVVDTLSRSQKASFREVVLIEFPRPGMKAVGFVTAYTSGPDGREDCIVFVPTVPNPTTGFMFIVPSSEVERTRIPIEEGFRWIVSVGVIPPGPGDSPLCPAPDVRGPASNAGAPGTPPAS
jgi:uncharacterized membrane protein